MMEMAVRPVSSARVDKSPGKKPSTVPLPERIFYIYFLFIFYLYLYFLDFYIFFIFYILFIILEIYGPCTLQIMA
jgi:hypothetical protein